MRICITTTGPNLDSPIDPRFGRCAYFLIVDLPAGQAGSETEKFEAVKNTGVEAWRGAGITAAQIVVDKKVEAVITGNIGPNAFGVLQASGVKIYAGIFSLTANDALGKYKGGELSEVKAPMTPGRFGPQRGGFRHGQR